MINVSNTLFTNKIVEITDCTTTNDFLNSILNTHRNLLCIHGNIGSIIKKLASLEQCIYNCIKHIDFIILSAVSILNSIVDQMFTALRQSRKGGGIIVYIHKNYKCKVKNINTYYFESIIFTVTAQSSYTTHLCEIY